MIRPFSCARGVRQLFATVYPSLEEKTTPEGYNVWSQNFLAEEFLKLWWQVSDRTKNPNHPRYGGKINKEG